MSYYKANTLCNHCPEQKNGQCQHPRSRPQDPDYFLPPPGALPGSCRSPRLRPPGRPRSHWRSKQRHPREGEDLLPPPPTSQTGAPGQCQRVVPTSQRRNATTHTTKLRNTARLTFPSLPSLRPPVTLETGQSQTPPQQGDEARKILAKGE